MDEQIEEKAVQVKLCPVCNGTGLFRERIGPQETLAYVCKACYGEKYIEVQVNKANYGFNENVTYWKE